MALLCLMGRPQPPPAPPLALELTVVSAQDLHPDVSRSMRTFAVVSGGNGRLRTPVDRSGHVDPTWNAKLSVPIDPAALSSDTSAISIDIYAARPWFRLWRRKALLGTARVLLSEVEPATPLVQFYALRVRRPSLRPQGIVNIGVAVVDSRPSTPPPSPAEADAAAREEKDKEGRSLKVMERKLEMWKEEVPAPVEEDADEAEAESRAEPIEGMAKEEEGKGKQG